MSIPWPNWSEAEWRARLHMRVAYAPDQPRDYHGRWTDGSGASLTRDEEAAQAERDKVEATRKDIVERVPAIAEKLGFPADKIDVYEVGPTRRDGRTAAMQYHPDSQRIAIYANQFTEDPSLVESFLSHEVEHWKFDKAFPGAIEGKETTGVFSDFIRENGGVDEFSRGGRRVSDYAASHWNAANAFEEPAALAISETLSELQRITTKAGVSWWDQMGQYEKDFGVWRKLYSEVDRRAHEARQARG